MQTQAIEVPKLLYSIAEAEIACSLSRATLYRLIAAGKLKTVQAGRKHKRLVPACALAEFLNSAPATTIKNSFSGADE